MAKQAAAPGRDRDEELRGQLDRAVRLCVPGAAGLAPGPGAVVQISGGNSAISRRVDVQLASGSVRRTCLRQQRHVPPGWSMAGEAEIMTAARRAGATVPEVLGVLPPGDALGQGYFTEWVDGESRGDKIAGSPAFASVREGGLLGRQCGETLAQIHKVDIARLRHLLPSGPPTPLGNLQRLRTSYGRDGVCRPALDYTLKWLEEHAPAARPEEAPVLVHGDFRSSNIMAHPARGVAGVLDWELAHVGNRYEDLSWICVRSWRYGHLDRPVGGFGDLEEFCSGYRDAGGIAVDRAALEWWIVLGSARWAMFCLNMGTNFRADPDLFEHGIVGRRVSECELDCLCMIADTLAGGVEGVLSGGAHAGSASGASGEAHPDASFPSNAELVEGAQRLLLRNLVAALDTAQDRRNAYIGRMVANALGMVARDLRMGPSAERSEADSLQSLLGIQGGGSADVLTLRRRMATAIQTGKMPLDKHGLLKHLMLTTGRQLSMDQPKYKSLDAIRSSL